MFYASQNMHRPFGQSRQHIYVTVIVRNVVRLIYVYIISASYLLHCSCFSVQIATSKNILFTSELQTANFLFNIRQILLLTSAERF